MHCRCIARWKVGGHHSWQRSQRGIIREGSFIMASGSTSGVQQHDEDRTQGENTGVHIQGQEVEVKLRIPDSASFAAVKSLLLPSFKTVHDQENHFFDGAKGELSSQRIVLRIRFYDGDQKAVITCKGKQVLENGIGRAPEEEEDIDIDLARSCLEDPNVLLTNEESALMKKLKDEMTFPDGLTHLGGFDNKRFVYNWRGYTLEADQTSYPWGSMFEIECETEEPEELKATLETFLSDNYIPFSDSKKSKFANFMDKTLE